MVARTPSGLMLIAALMIASAPPLAPDDAVFIRGDSNRDGVVQISDALFTLGFLFLGETDPSCLDAADANDDGAVDIADAVVTLESLFLTGLPLPPPSGAAGADPTADALDCAGSPGGAFRTIAMECMDRVSNGGTLEVVVRTQAEYEALIDERFQKPLDEYWDANYEDVKAGVRDRNPGISDAACEERVRESFFAVLPFLGTEDCSFEGLDFDAVTLLGIDAHATGCVWPTPTVSISRDDDAGAVTFTVTIVERGSCEPFWAQNVWVLVPRVPAEHRVVFAREYVREEL